MHTEGEGFSEYPNVKNYKLNQIYFPLGIGARYDVSAIINLRAEIVTRFLTTDYLDDVSGRYVDPSVFANYLSGVQLNEALLLMTDINLAQKQRILMAFGEIPKIMILISPLT